MARGKCAKKLGFSLNSLLKRMRAWDLSNLLEKYINIDFIKNTFLQKTYSISEKNIPNPNHMTKQLIQIKQLLSKRKKNKHESEEKMAFIFKQINWPAAKCHKNVNVFISHGLKLEARRDLYFESIMLREY